jgi:uncharacterized protein YbjT (DUF2867 family)
MEMNWTILRPHSFMQNWLDDVAATIRAEGVIYSPIGEAVVPFGDVVRAISDATSKKILGRPAHGGRFCARPCPGVST